jgi:hypothetical protein
MSRLPPFALRRIAAILNRLPEEDLDVVAKLTPLSRLYEDNQTEPTESTLSQGVSGLTAIHRQIAKKTAGGLRALIEDLRELSTTEVIEGEKTVFCFHPDVLEKTREVGVSIMRWGKGLVLYQMPIDELASYLFAQDKLRAHGINTTRAEIAGLSDVKTADEAFLATQYIDRKPIGTLDPKNVFKTSHFLVHHPDLYPLFVAYATHMTGKIERVMFEHTIAAYEAREKSAESLQRLGVNLDDETSEQYEAILASYIRYSDQPNTDIHLSNFAVTGGVMRIPEEVLRDFNQNFSGFVRFLTQVFDYDGYTARDVLVDNPEKFTQLCDLLRQRFPNIDSKDLDDLSRYCLHYDLEGMCKRVPRGHNYGSLLFRDDYQIPISFEEKTEIVERFSGMHKVPQILLHCGWRGVRELVNLKEKTPDIEYRVNSFWHKHFDVPMGLCAPELVKAILHSPQARQYAML